MEHGPLSRSRRGLWLQPDCYRRPRFDRDRSRLGRCTRRDCQADRGDRADREGKGFQRDRKQRRMAWQGFARRYGGARHQRAGRAPQPEGRGRQARARRARHQGLPCASDAASLQEGGKGRHPQGVWRYAQGTRRASHRGGDGRRGEQLHPRGRVQAGLPRPILRDVHSGTAAGLDRSGHERPPLHPVRLHLCRLLHARLRLHPDGGHLPGQHSPLRVSRRGRNRGGWTVTDGARGPGRHAGGSWLNRALPFGCHLHGSAR